MDFYIDIPITELDVVVRGQGKTISAGKNQLVQSPEAGISSTFVDEGAIIDSGAKLFEIKARANLKGNFYNFQNDLLRLILRN